MSFPSNSGERPATPISSGASREDASSSINRLPAAALATLRRELARQPEVRPDVVRRARALRADPSYPSMAILRSIARQILLSPDLSEEPV